MPFPNDLNDTEYQKAFNLLIENIPKSTMTKTAKTICSNKDLKLFTLEDFCKVYRAIDFNRREFAKFYHQNNKTNKLTTIRTKANRFKKIFEMFDSKKLAKERVINSTIESKVEKEHRQTKIQIEKTKNIMSIFNLRPKELEERIYELYQMNKDISVEDYLKELHVLRLVFLEMAKGSLVTTKITATYEVDEDDKGNITSKRIYTTRTGKKLITVESQSHLPDSKALIGMNLIEDLILKASSTLDGSVVDEDEIQEMYVELLENAQLQRISLQGRK